MLLDFACLVLLALTITGWQMREERFGRRIAVVALVLLLGMVCFVPTMRASFVVGFTDGWSNTLSYLGFR